MVDKHIALDKAVILASGYGKRMGKKNNDCSKPMTLVHGKPLISYSIDMLIACGIKEIYVVYHNVTSDVIRLLDLDSRYSGYLKFIQEDQQGGTLLTFSRVKDILSPPFLMTFEDIIAKTDDFVDMMNTGKKILSKRLDVDLVLQTVEKPTIETERCLIIEDGYILDYYKNGVNDDDVKSNQVVKCGGMVFLWMSDPFPLIGQFIDLGNYKLSSFLKYYIEHHKVMEMSIQDMWDIDTVISLELSEEIIIEWR